MTLVFNRHKDIEKRRILRHTMPEAEVILWSRLQKKAIGGFKFRRQYGIGHYVADFYCPQAKLVVEVDGDSHYTNEAEKYDKKRETYINSLGLRVMRFTNLEVRNNVNEVVEQIAEVLNPSVPPDGGTPPLGKGRK